MKYRTEKEGDLVTIFDEDKGVGLRFKEGETLQAYTSEIIVRDSKILSTLEGVALVSETSERLRRYASEHYKKEFQEIKQYDGR